MPATMTDEQFEALLPQQQTASAPAQRRGMTDDEFNALLPPQQPPQQPEQSWGQWAGDLAMQAAFPHQMIGESLAQLPGSLLEAGRSMVSTAGEEGPELARHLADLPETEYRMLGRSFGLPVDPPSPESMENWRSTLADVLLTGAGGKLGQVIGSRSGDVAKYLSRGGRTTIGVERDLPMMPGAEAAGGSAWRTAKDLLSPVISGVAANRFTDWMNPASPFGGGEFGDAIIAGGAGTAVGALVARNTLTDLMTTDPKWRRIMMSPSKGTAMTLIGAALGHLTAQGLQATEETVKGLVEGVERQLDEKPVTKRYPPGSVFPLPLRDPPGVVRG